MKVSMEDVYDLVDWMDAGSLDDGTDDNDNDSEDESND